VGCIESNKWQIKYSGAIVFAVQLGACNDPIAIVPGDQEGCHLPLSIHLVLQLVWHTKSE
jgi:hypothetical protein